MERKVLVTVKSRQRYGEMEEAMELTSEGTLIREEDALLLRYDETEISGLAGTQTVFRMEPGRVILERTGTLNSRMEFVPDAFHKSLYRMGEGALFLSVHTTLVDNRMEDEGGTLRVAYEIEIEETASGSIEYDVLVTPV